MRLERRKATPTPINISEANIIGSVPFAPVVGSCGFSGITGVSFD
jgi:hypothetical protein